MSTDALTGDAAAIQRIAELIRRHARAEGVTDTPIDDFALFSSTVDLPRRPELEVPSLILHVQGTKVCHYADVTRRFDGPLVVVGLFPTPVETEFVGVTPDRPFLAAGLHLDTARLADVALRLENIGERAGPAASASSHAKFAVPFNPELATAAIRVLELLDDRRDVAMLGPAAVDELYYRLLTGPNGAEIRNLLLQNDDVRRISEAVGLIHAHLDRPVAVDDLAAAVHMSRSTFYEAFRDVMGSAPLQYAKSVKLLEAQRLIRGGSSVTDAGTAVGYANLGQFSREYKRTFGRPPSLDHST